jgi:hypothetical protein
MIKAYVIRNDIDTWEETPDAPAPLLALANAKKHDQGKEPSVSGGQDISAEWVSDGLPKVRPAKDRDTWRNQVCSIGCMAGLLRTKDGRYLEDHEVEELADAFSAQDPEAYNKPGANGLSGRHAVKQILGTMKLSDNPGSISAASIIKEIHAALKAKGEDTDHNWHDPERFKEVFAKLNEAERDQSEDDPKEKTAHKFFQSRADFRDRPPSKRALDKVIHEDADACIVGPSQHLKSETMTHLGGDWCGNENFLGDIPICIPKDQRGPVFYAAPEDPDFLGEVRVTAWEMKYGDGPFTCDRFYILDGIPLLGDLASQDRFIAEVEKLTPPGTRPVIMFDTLIQSLNGNPEDSSNTMTEYCQMVKRIRLKTNAYCTVTAHHMGWETNRSRGSSALYQGMDTMIYLTDRTENFTVKMTMHKVKQGRAGAVRYVRSTPIMTPKGEGFTLAFTGQPPAPAKSERNNAKGVLDDMFGKISRSLLAKGMIRPKACDTSTMLLHLAAQEREIDDSMTPPQVRAGVERMRGRVRRASLKDNRIDALGFETPDDKLRWGLTKDQASLISEPDEDQDGAGSGEDLT